MRPGPVQHSLCVRVSMRPKNPDCSGILHNILKLHPFAVIVQLLLGASYADRMVVTELVHTHLSQSKYAVLDDVVSNPGVLKIIDIGSPRCDDYSTGHLQVHRSTNYWSK